MGVGMGGLAAASLARRVGFNAAGTANLVNQCVALGADALGGGAPNLLQLHHRPPSRPLEAHQPQALPQLRVEEPAARTCCSTS